MIVVAQIQSSVHGTRRQDISAGLCRQGSFRVYPIWTISSSIYRNENSRGIWSTGRDLWYTRNGFRISSSRECLKMAMWAAEECSGNLGSICPRLHCRFVWAKDCTLEYWLHIVFPTCLVRTTWLHGTSFWIGQRLDTVGTSAWYRSLGS